MDDRSQRTHQAHPTAAVVNQQQNITGPHRWQPGESGNRAGRPTGSRQKIAEALLKDIAAVWERRGAEVLERLATDDPAALAKIAFGLLPREALISVQQQAPAGLDAEQWSRLREILAMVERVAPPGTSPDAVLMALENGLRAEFARPILPAPPY
ncbi:MAG: hypothetical protein JOZ70_15990 [Pseudolabrys sp.]|nr:hypothetical protein [Pseudolabrys sp.]